MQHLIPEFDRMRRRYPPGFESSLVLPCLRRIQDDRGYIADEDIDGLVDYLGDKLSLMAPADASYFASRYADFDKRLAEAEQRWDALMAPYKGLKIVTYHRSCPSFADRFGLDVIGYVEPRPGIPPSPRHTIDLIAEMKLIYNKTRQAAITKELSEIVSGAAAIGG